MTDHSDIAKPLLEWYTSDEAAAARASLYAPGAAARRGMQQIEHNMQKYGHPFHRPVPYGEEQ